MSEEYEFDFLWQTTRRRSETTGLPATIWVDDGGAYRRTGGGKRIWFQLDVGNPLTTRLGAMDLDGNVLEPEKVEDSDLIRQITNFVGNNKLMLDLLADGRMDVDDVWHLTIRGGEIATEMEIAALKAGVNKLTRRSLKSNERLLNER